MPAIADAAAAHRAALAKGEAAAFDRMLRSYGRVWDNVALELDQLTAQIEAATIAGEPVSPSWLYRESRMANLKAAIEAEVTRFARSANAETVAAQSRAVTAAAAGGVELMAASALTLGTVGDFALPTTAALDALVGHLADGSPLTRLFAALPGDASQRAEQALLRGVARGMGPRAIASEMRQALGGNLARALTIARTETNRAYRSAARLTYEANADVLDGWRWTCARQLRTCAMCWALDGTRHPVTRTLDSHPNCRCAMVPVVKGGATEHPPPAEDAFAKLSEADQRAVLGRAKLAAYRSGELNLRDFVGRTDDRRWGTTRHELSLTDARAMRGKDMGRRIGTDPDKPKRIRRPTTAAERAAMRDVAPYRAMARSEAGRVADDADRILERLEGGRLKAPPLQRSVTDRLRGRVSRSDAGGEWDWFYRLHPDEQARLRRGWAGGPSTSMGPDELTDLMAKHLGMSNENEAIEYWLDLTRRHEAAKVLELGKLPAENLYGGLDVDELLPGMRDEGFRLTRLFDTDAEAAARHAAEANAEMGAVEAARTLPRISHGPAPWEMSPADYATELDDTLADMATVRPTAVDELGPTYSSADAATIARYDELWPPDLEDAGTVTPEAMHARMVELATRAGLI